MDKKLKLLKETWEQLNEFMKVHEYSAGSDLGKGFYTFFISGIEYVASVDEFHWKEYEGLDVSFGVVRRGHKDRLGPLDPWVDYQTTIDSVDATDVVATVIDITFGVAEEEMADKQEWILSFNPAKEDYDQLGIQTKRSSLYERMVKRLAQNYGWLLSKTIRMDKDSVAFIMTSIE